MSLSKSERTSHYILEIVAPIFNKKGYVGTSMGVIEKATGLTKGAIYGNFKNKEELALAAFNYSLKKIMSPMNAKVRAEATAIGKLKAMTDYYRTSYRSHMNEMGGCTILNVGVDAHHQNPRLFERAKVVVEKLKSGIVDMLNQGKAEGTLREDFPTDIMASRIYSMMQGSIFMSMTLENESYLIDMMDYLDKMIDTELTK